MAARTLLSVPRYRVEERLRGLAAFIVGFADRLAQYQVVLARRAAQLSRARVPAELVVIDQEREVIVVRREVTLGEPGSPCRP
jgi:hypothetical protein